MPRTRMSVFIMAITIRASSQAMIKDRKHRNQAVHKASDLSAVMQLAFYLTQEEQAPTREEQAPRPHSNAFEFALTTLKPLTLGSV